MKKFFLGIVLLGLVYSGYTFFPKQKIITPTGSSATQQQEVRSVQTEQTKIAEPKKLLIPKLAIEADVESVGMDEKGRMDVPKIAENVAWYNLGFLPGKDGSAVIAGHFDKESGEPAVFYHLKELTIGDKIQIMDVDNNMRSFSVTEMKRYDHDAFPLQEVFNTTDTARLNLITCDGVFNETEKNYSKRFVVYAVLDK